MNKTQVSSKDHLEQKMVGWLVLFNGISTLVGYLMPNLVYTYTLNIYGL